LTDDDFNPLSAEFRADPFAVYRRFLRERPVHRNANGTWFVSRHKDVAALLNDPKRVIKKPEILLKQFRPGPFREHNRHNMNFMDPPDHTRVRATVARYFTPRALQELVPRIAAIADDLLDRAGGAFDLIRDYAILLPVYVICEMMGVPATERERFKRWSADVVAGLEPGARPESIAAAEAACVEFAVFFAELAEQRRRQPGGTDLLSVLTRHEQEDKLHPLELVHNAAFLLNAGHETTTNLIGNGVQALLQAPDQLRRLRAEPALIDRAIEEFLRYDPPLHLTFRRTAADIDLGDAVIGAGDGVLFSLAGANRDPSVFESPDRLDIARHENRHLSFAPGVHFCLGATLARYEGRIAIGTLLRRYPNLAPAGAPARNTGIIFQGFNRLPVHLGPRAA